MSAGILYLIGTIAAWVGWASAAFAVYRSVDTLMKPAGIARKRSMQSFIASAGTGAICLLIAASLPMPGGVPFTGWRLPLVWPILPFAAWASVACLCFALYRGLQLVLDRGQRSDSLRYPAIRNGDALGSSVGSEVYPLRDGRLSERNEALGELSPESPPSLVARPTESPRVVLGEVEGAAGKTAGTTQLLETPATTPYYRPEFTQRGAGPGILDFQRDQNRARVRQFIVCLLVAIGFFAIFKNSGDPINIAKGGIAFKPATGVAIGLFAVLALVAMAIAAQYSRSRGIAKKVILHTMLVIGSIVFGLPFLWLVITSFKEDQDMSSANGLVWVPHVTEQMPYRDPGDPYYKGKLNRQTVLADVIEKEPNGQVKLNIAHPMSLQGETFLAFPSQLKEVDRMGDVVTGTYEGQSIEGHVVKEFMDGHKLVDILKPASLANQTYVANPADIQAVRHVGLKWQNYPDSLDYLPPEAHEGLTYLENTLILVFFNVLGTILSSSLVAYAFARLKFPGKGFMFTVLISTMMLPAAITLLPQFLIFRALGWIDTLYPLWVPAFFASAFNVFLLRQFFMTIPKELEDASKIDGCTYLKTFWSVMLPQVTPALAVIGIWTFMAVWNNFMGPLVYINSPEHMPISYAVQLYQGDRSGEPGLLMAFATMSMIPVLALFFGAQKYFIEGVTISGLGGR